MKKYIANTLAALMLAVGVSGCGNSFLETDIYDSIDREDALTSVSKIGTALNGTYYTLFYYPFAGNYALSLGDIPTDIAFFNPRLGHFNTIYQYTYTDTDNYLSGVWEYGYKVVDGAARIIEAGEAMYDTLDESDKEQLDIYLGEAYALRGYAYLVLTNIFSHQIKVNGQDFSNEPGIVLADKPIEADQQISRSTVGKSFEAVVNDLKASIEHFETAGTDKKQLVYFNKAAAYGLLARASMYLENWDDAAGYAQKALDAKGITALNAYTPEAYQALYNDGTSNSESMFALAITTNQNWSANSLGTLWTTYNYYPSSKLLSLYAETDCRKDMMTSYTTSNNVTYFDGGKFGHYSSGNPAYATCYIVNAPEMFLIQAEANIKKTNPDLEAAQNSLLEVAKRNSAIATVSDLPSTADDLMGFIKDERARELFQEGFRLFDLRRWDETVGVNAQGTYDNNTPQYTDYQISKLVFPIPADEINSHYGVTQNEGWATVRPR